jgi:allantoicase
MTASFLDLVDLASERIGAAVIAANDEFFAAKESLIKAGPPIWREGEYTERGKWMDGWETRRRRDGGDADWCIVRLGVPGVVRGVVVDTAHFKGNFPESCAIDAWQGSSATAPDDLARAAWREILRRTPLAGDTRNEIAIDAGDRATHIRLRIFPDGGVARLRVYGEAEIDWASLAHAKRPLDLASIRNGGLVLGASDMHFGARDNMIMPGRARNMGDGWETRRRRGSGVDPITGLRADWAVVRLGAPGIVHRIEIDTSHFKGNYPESASVDGCLRPGATLDELLAARWTPVLSREPLGPNRRQVFTSEITPAGPVSHVRLNIFPDGGISRLRVYGAVAAD